MPTYEYRCAEGHTFERFQRMTEPPVSVCPECGAASERLLSAGAGILFKGSGFYITDYRSDSYKKAAESEKSGGAAGGGEKAGAKEVKPGSTKGSASGSSSATSSSATGD